MSMASVARVLGVAATAAMLLGSGGAATAQEAKPGEAAAAAEAPAPDTGRIALSAGVDFPTRYYFRGILQERQDYIIQPFADITVKLYESKGPLSALALTLGTWNSLHGGKTGVEGSATVDPKIWYEADFFATLSTTWFEDFTAALTYTAYMSPNDAFGTVQEMALTLGYNDARWLGAFALNPTLLFAFEMKGQADAGDHLGGVVQIGIAPGYTFFKEMAYPLSISAPIAVSLSLYDYYEFGTGEGDTFGAFSAGLKASVPLKFIPAAFGSWQARASVVYYHFGDNLTTVNRGDRDSVVGLFGLSMSY
jgi:hypothetical protein